MPIIYLSCAWIAGTFLGAKLDLPLALGLTGLIPLPILLTRRHRKLIVLASLAIIIFFAAAAYSWSSLHKVDPNSLQSYNGRGVLAVKGTVASDPEVGGRETSLELSASEIKLGTGWQAVKGTARLFVPRYPAYRYGDILMVTGRLETPFQLGDFDYKDYLAHRGIYSTMSYPKIEVLEHRKGFKPLEWLYALRSRLAETLAQALPEPQASLAQGIILGIRGNIPAPVKADFYQTGTTHILAISGMNLSIITGILLGLWIWVLGRRHFIYIWLTLGTIWFYTLLTGAQPPVVRAAIMASIFLAAELLGRQRSAMTALVLAAAIMVGINPSVLWDASFQLSFLAMSGLVYLFPAFQALGRRTVEARLGEDGLTVSIANLVSDSLAMTMAATIAVWPLVANHFGIISLIGPLATVLVLPVLPAIVITGALTGVLGLFFLPAAQVMGWFAWPFLSYMILAVNILARPQLTFLEVGTVNTGLIWTYYLTLAITIWLKGHWQRLGGEVTARLKAGANAASRLPAKWIIPPLLVLAVLTTSAAASMPDDRLHVSFLDVGEGDAIFIQKGNQNVLVDGGPSPQAIDLGLSGKMPFWGRNIDLMVLTHPHSDHLAGLVEVLQRYKVRQVLYPDLDYQSPVYEEWRRLVQTKGIQSTVARDGQGIKLSGNAVIKVLNPATDSTLDMDDRSLVLRLSMGNISFLLTADLMEAGEAELVRQRAGLASTVLKIGHHGSKTSTSPGFLAVVDPQVAAISVGDNNRFGHPGAEVLERLKTRLGANQTYRTDLNGTIEFITDGQRLWVKPEK